MKVRVRYFGLLAESAGRSSDTLDVPEPATAGDVLRAVRTRLDVPPSVRLAVDDDYVRRDARLKPGDTVSLIPPVAGG